MLLKSNSRTRKTTAASLALVAAILFFLAVLVVSTLKLIGLFAGGRELQNATDSGNLNVARSAVNKFGIPLQAGEEKGNFAGLLNSNKQVDLVCYNRIVGQCLLVALNAAAENTDQAKTNSKAVLALVQNPSGGNCLSQRLRDTLSNQQTMDPYFTKLANSNPIGMLSDTSVKAPANSYAVGYLYPDGLTNIYMDSTIVPTGVIIPANAVSRTKASSGFPYISGYSNLAFGSLGASLSGVSVQPRQAPHLISNADFDSHKQQPLPSLTLPPNAFRSVGTPLCQH